MLLIKLQVKWASYVVKDRGQSASLKQHHQRLQRSTELNQQIWAIRLINWKMKEEMNLQDPRQKKSSKGMRPMCDPKAPLLKIRILIF
jgi:hypothetical protein